MKKVLSLVLAAVLAASLSACGGALVDLDTPKSEELTAQYDFYPDAMNSIRADMKITPEQADEVFIVLTSCGLDGKITSISESKGAYTVYYGGSSLDVTLSDGAVETVYSGRDMLYPEYRKHNVLMDYDLTVKDVKTGSGDKIGEYAYIRITKAQLQAITEENYKEFVETVVTHQGRCLTHVPAGERADGHIDNTDVESVALLQDEVETGQDIGNIAAAPFVQYLYRDQVAARGDSAKTPGAFFSVPADDAADMGAVPVVIIGNSATAYHIKKRSDARLKVFMRKTPGIQNCYAETAPGKAVRAVCRGKWGGCTHGEPRHSFYC